MKLVPSDPDLESIVRRIRENELNLQPDFQRGEIWSISKKQKLIDSILRNWYVPPIHIIVDSTRGVEDVLDGQQRLAAVRDFASGGIRVDGTILPVDSKIASLDGLTYFELPPESKKIFDRFSIRVFRIFDYAPEEPYELFFRLNQSVVLTAAEQRNTFFGEAREQVRWLVSALEKRGIDFQRVGFSNSRMAYDDIIARLCLVLEFETLNVKIGANLLTEKYRSRDGFPDRVINRAEHAINLFAEAIGSFTYPHKFNKATFFSWLYFVADAIGDRDLSSPDLAQFVEAFERLRKEAKEAFAGRQPRLSSFSAGSQLLSFVHMFNDRATARVWDTSSVLIRDVVLWVVLVSKVDNFPLFDVLKSSKKTREIDHRLSYDSGSSAKEIVEDLLNSPVWSSR